jgi:hypothetical protein
MKGIGREELSRHLPGRTEENYENSGRRKMPCFISRSVDTGVTITVNAMGMRMDDEDERL